MVRGPWLGAQRAFTILELLVAATITVFLAGFIAVVVRNVSETWTRASNRLGTDAQARIILDQLQLDLQGALFQDDGNVWMAADVLTAQSGNPGAPWQRALGISKPVGRISLDMTATRTELPPQERRRLEHTRYGTAGIWLRFFTTSRSVDSSDDLTAPVAVGYQVVRRFNATNTRNQNTAYLLHRTQVRSHADRNGRPGVLESGYDITASDYTTRGGSRNDGSITGDPYTIQTASTARNLDTVIADNVVDFGLRCYVNDPGTAGGLRLIFPALASGQPSNRTDLPLRAQLPGTTPATAPNYNHRFLFPDVIDVMVRILSDEGAALIANMERTRGQAPQKYNRSVEQWWWGVAQEHSRVYTRRIVINAQPL